MFICTCIQICVCICSDGLVIKSCPTLVTLWTIACQAPLSMGFSRQEYWSGLPLPSPGDLSHPGIEPRSPALQADSLLTELWRKPSHCIWWAIYHSECYILFFSTTYVYLYIYIYIYIHIHIKVKVKSPSRVWLFATPWTVAHQAPLSMEFSRQEYWSGLHLLLQEIFLTQGSNLHLPHCRML